MTKHKRNEIILGVLLVAVATTIWHNLRDEGSESPRIIPIRSEGRSVVGAGDLKVYPVDWVALAAPRPAYDPSGRNIFKWSVNRVSPTSTEGRASVAYQQGPTPTPATVPAPPPAAAPISVVSTPPAPRPPQVPYAFIGYVGPADRKTAVLDDGSGPIFAQQGEIVGGQFKIMDIGYESIRFGYTDSRFRDETILRMSSSH